MTPHPDPHLMTAQRHPTTTDASPDHPGLADAAPGEGVKAVELFNRRSDRRRAWDQLSEIDRAVLLESVRQRRDAQELRRAALQSQHGTRQIR